MTHPSRRHSVDNADVLRNRLLTQASGTAAREAAAEETLRKRGVARDRLSAVKKEIAELEADADEDDAAPMESDDGATAAACLKALRCEAADLLPQLGTNIGELKPCYPGCKCKMKCDTNSCSCRKAQEACGPLCGCTHDGVCVCESPFTALVIAYKRALELGRVPREVAVLNATKDKNYLMLDWIQAVLTFFRTANLTEFPHGEPQVAAAEQTHEHLLGPMDGMLTLQKMQREEDTAYAQAACRLIEEAPPFPPPAAEGADRRAPEPPSEEGEEGSTPQPCQRADCRSCPRQYAFRLPAKGSATESSVAYSRASAGTLPPAKEADFYVLPVTQYANPNNADAMRAACQPIDAALSDITGGAKPLMAAAAPAGTTAPEGEDDEGGDSDDPEADADAEVPLAPARMASHCGICRHVGTKVSHAKAGCAACGTPAGTACRADGPPCGCTVHAAAAAAEAAADKEARNMDAAFVPPLPWLAHMGNFSSCVPEFEAKVLVLSTHIARLGMDVDETVPAGWGPFIAAAGEALRALGLAAGGGKLEAAHKAKASALLDAVITRAAAMDPTKRVPRWGAGPRHLYRQADGPLYELLRYLQLRDEVAGVLVLAGLHNRMSVFESICHSNAPLGVRKLLRALSLRTDGQLDWVENGHSDIANTMEVFRMVYAAIKIHLLMRFQQHPPDVAVASCAAFAACARVLLAPHGAATASTTLLLSEFSAGVESAEPPTWLERLCTAATSNTVAVTFSGTTHIITGSSEPAMIDALRAVAREVDAAASSAADAMLTHFYDWLKFRCAADPTLMAWVQYAGQLFIAFKYHESGRAGPAQSRLRNLTTCLTGLIYAADSRKPCYRRIITEHAWDLNMKWSKNVLEGNALASTHALTDDEKGGHNVDEDEKMETTVGYTKEGANRAGHISTSTVERVAPSCMALKGVDTLVRDQYGVKTRSKRHVLRSRIKVLGCVASSAQSVAHIGCRC